MMDLEYRKKKGSNRKVAKRPGQQQPIRLVPQSLEKKGLFSDRIFDPMVVDSSIPEIARFLLKSGFRQFLPFIDPYILLYFWEYAEHTKSHI